MDFPVQPAEINTILFSLMVLLLATVACVLFMLSLPAQPHSNQRQALQLFTLFFISVFFAFVLYCLRFWGFYLWSVVSNNLLYVLGCYFFYFGVRARYGCRLRSQIVLGATVHLLLLSVLMWYFSAIKDDVLMRLPILLLSMCVPILLSFSTIRAHSHNGNLGDKILQLGCLVALFLLPLLFPLFSFLLKPDAPGQLYVTTLVTLTLQTLCVGGLAMSYIYDLIDKLRHDAHTDKLTGAKNRRYFFRVAPKLIEQSQQQQQAICLVMIDLDYFKQVNDNYGHQVGDEVLHSFATLLLQHLSEKDLLARYGGEEFVVLLPGKNLAQATAWVNQIRNQLSSVAMATPQQAPPLFLTASFGLLLCPPQQEVEEVIKQADEALLRAKLAGRNRLELA